MHHDRTLTPGLCLRPGLQAARDGQRQRRGRCHGGDACGERRGVRGGVFQALRGRAGRDRADGGVPRARDGRGGQGRGRRGAPEQPRPDEVGLCAASPRRFQPCRLRHAGAGGADTPDS
eukprot:scaffold77322_cov58-Phaeocystis_antarctica.AAC.1